jgi:uncharacterized membrane protein (DUF373 family)
MFLVGVIAVHATILAAFDLVSDMWVSHSFPEKEALQDTFGHIPTIVILLEFNHSIYVALTERAGAIQTRIVVLIGVLVVARKLMLQDFATLDVQALLGFGGLLLALGGLYWLLSDADRRRAQSASQEQRSGA